MDCKCEVGGGGKNQEKNLGFCSNVWGRWWYHLLGWNKQLEEEAGNFHFKYSTFTVNEIST